MHPRTGALFDVARRTAGSSEASAPAALVWHDGTGFGVAFASSLFVASHFDPVLWRLPLPDDLKEQLKSKIADMKNTGERWGGALTAGLFLSEFTEGRRWLHVDIAGPAMASKAYGVTTAGGTGFPVATILEFLAGDVRVKAP